MMTKHPYSYIIEYVPIRFGNEDPAIQQNRKAVFEFMQGKCQKEYLQKIIEEINRIIADDPGDWVLCFIPASTDIRTQTRYAPIAEALKSRDDITVSLEAIACFKDREAWHLSTDKNNMVFNNLYQVNEYYNKKVILMDDLIATGRTFRTVSNVLLETGAKKVHGLIFSKTVHPKDDTLFIYNKEDEKVNPDGIILTRQLIEEGISSQGGYNSRQLKALGIDWPPPKGWKEKLVGTSIALNDYKMFLKNKKI